MQLTTLISCRAARLKQRCASANRSRHAASRRRRRCGPSAAAVGAPDPGACASSSLPHTLLARAHATLSANAAAKSTSDRSKKALVTKA